MKRPYDVDMSQAMINTTAWLTEETNALMGYTQSDEISLVWHSDTFESQVFFDAKIQKMVSVLAAMASVEFVRQATDRHLISRRPSSGPLDQNRPKLPVFDCRVWNVPNRVEAANVFLWREKDATKNSIAMAARHYYSHKELHNKSGKEMQEMLFQKYDVNWNDYPAFFKRGVFIQRRKVLRPFTMDELMVIPEKHRPPPGTEVERTQYIELDMPPFVKVTNRVEVVFEGADPICETSGICRQMPIIAPNNEA
jgi:tRNA(His) 5'-end guanylyltransferase